jgi:hypothetical protein
MTAPLPVTSLFCPHPILTRLYAVLSTPAGKYFTSYRAN